MGREKSEGKRERNEALYLVYKRIKSEHPELSEPEIAELARNAPQERLWVPFYSVYRILRRIRRNEQEKERREARKGLYEVVKQTYDKLKEQRMFRDKSRPAYFLTSFIIAEPAKGFYISQASALRIIWEMRKEKQKRWRRK